MGENVVKDRSRDFALDSIKLYKKLYQEKKEYVISKQFLRAATSIGANIAEANFAISKKEFLSKMYIALKEASETDYWIDLLYTAGYISENEYRQIYKKCQDILSLLKAITKSTRETMEE